MVMSKVSALTLDLASSHRFFNSQQTRSSSQISNHCLRYLNRNSNQTDQYAGNCTHEGNQNGVNALLNKPRSLINDLKNPGHVLISEQGGIIKTMNTTNRNVSYFGTVGSEVYSFIQEDCSGNLFMGVADAVGVYSYHTKTFTVIAGSTSRGFQDGPSSEVQFKYNLIDSEVQFN